MATNVTEKDKTLHEVIDFLQKEWDAANNVSDNPDEEVYDFYDGMTTAYEHVINYCRHLLGYSGSMLSCLTYEDTDNSDPIRSAPGGRLRRGSPQDSRTARRKYPSTSNGRNAPDCQSHS